MFAISLFLYHHIAICICHLYHFCADRKFGKLHETIYCCSLVHEASLLSPKSKLVFSFRLKCSTTSDAVIDWQPIIIGC